MASLPYPRSHQTIFPQNSRNTQKQLAEKKNLCTSVKSVGEYPPPEASVYSVNSVGGLAQTNLEWVLWKEFGGRRGYGRDAIPSYFCVFCEIRGRISSARNFCEFREFRGRTCANKLGVGSVEGIRRAAWVWQGCHTLLRKLPRIARMCTD